MAKRKRPDAAERLFRDTMRRVLAIPSDEAKAICERTAPGAPRGAPKSPTPTKRAAR